MRPSFAHQKPCKLQRDTLCVTSPLLSPKTTLQLNLLHSWATNAPQRQTQTGPQSRPLHHICFTTSPLNCSHSPVRHIRARKPFFELTLTALCITLASRHIYFNCIFQSNALQPPSQTIRKLPFTAHSLTKRNNTRWLSHASALYICGTTPSVIWVLGSGCDAVGCERQFEKGFGNKKLTSP